MKKKTVLAALATLTLLSAGFAYRAAAGSGERPDCPGKIVCPLTGEVICADQCPIGSESGSAEVPSCCKSDS